MDATSLRELVGADQRGLGAMELLAAGPIDERACAYLLGAAELIAGETAALANEWTTYGPTLAADDEAANATLDELVSETIFALPLTSSDNPMAAGQLAGARFALVGDGSSKGISPLLDDAVVEQLEADFDALAAIRGSTPRWPSSRPSRPTSSAIWGSRSSSPMLTATADAAARPVSAASYVAFRAAFGALAAFSAARFLWRGWVGQFTSPPPTT